MNVYWLLIKDEFPDVLQKIKSIQIQFFRWYLCKKRFFLNIRRNKTIKETAVVSGRKAQASLTSFSFFLLEMLKKNDYSDTRFYLCFFVK